MKVEIDTDEYLDKKEIKEIIETAIQDCVYRKYSSEKEQERLISNLSYQYVFKMIDEAIDDNLEELIKRNVIRIINDMTSYSVFRHKNMYGDDDSLGTKIINEEVENSRDLIKQKVEEHINGYHYQDVKDNICDYVYECINDKLFGQEK